MPVGLVLYSIAINFVGDATKSFLYRRKTGLICFCISSFYFLTIKLLAVTRFNALLKLRILQGRVAPEVKSKLYENTEVRYNNALFLIKLYTADEEK